MKTTFERFMDWKRSKPKNDIQLQAKIDELEHEFKNQKYIETKIVKRMLEKSIENE